MAQKSNKSPLFSFPAKIRAVKLCIYARELMNVLNIWVRHWYYWVREKLNGTVWGMPCGDGYTLLCYITFQVVDILKLAMAEGSSASEAGTSGRAAEAARMLNAVLASLASGPGACVCVHVCVCMWEGGNLGYFNPS